MTRTVLALLVVGLPAGTLAQLPDVPVDATRSPAVLEAGRLLRASLRQIQPEDPEARAVLGLPRPAQITAEDHGNVVVIRGNSTTRSSRSCRGSTPRTAGRIRTSSPC